MIQIFYSYNVTINGVYFYDLFELKNRVLMIYYFQNLLIDGITMSNKIEVQENIVPINMFRPNKNSILEIRNMSANSFNLLDRPLISSLNPSMLKLSNSVFENLQMNTQGIIINTGPINGLQISNVTFKGITGSTPSNIVNTLIAITSMDLSSTNSYFIKDISIFNSSSSFMTLSSVLNTPKIPQFLNISNILYGNGVIQYENDLIILGNLATQLDFTISFSNITFSSLIFERGGNMLYFKQQMKNSVLLQNIVIYNITGGSITIESANLQNLTTPTKLTFTNLTANMLNGNYYSFINILTGGVLEINNSSFSNIFNFQSGAVIYAGYTNSTTTIRNSVFINNTSLKGGVFNIEYNSLVILDN